MLFVRDINKLNPASKVVTMRYANCNFFEVLAFYPNRNNSKHQSPNFKQILVLLHNVIFLGNNSYIEIFIQIRNYLRWIYSVYLNAIPHTLINIFTGDYHEL